MGSRQSSLGTAIVVGVHRDQNFQSRLAGTAAKVPAGITGTAGTLINNLELMSIYELLTAQSSQLHVTRSIVNFDFVKQMQCNLYFDWF